MLIIIKYLSKDFLLKEKYNQYVNYNVNYNMKGKEKTINNVYSLSS